MVEAIETYFENFEYWPYAYEIVGNRIDRLAKKANINTTPHGLRGTAATKFAYDGMPASVLQMLFGWVKIETANHYVARSGYLAIKQMKEMYASKNIRQNGLLHQKQLCLTNLAWKICRRKRIRFSEEKFRSLFI